MNTKTRVGIFAMIWLCSCSSQHYAHKLDKLKSKCDSKRDDIKAVPAERCASWYPVKETTKTVVTTKSVRDTITLKGETVYADCSEAVTSALDDAARKRIPVKCPDISYVEFHDTVTVTDSVFRENTASVTALTLELDKAQKDKTKAVAAKSFVTKWAVYSSFAALALLVLFILGITRKI